MAYLLRFVQRFRPADERAFMALEKQFAALERRKRGLPARPPQPAVRGPRAGTHPHLGLRVCEPRRRRAGAREPVGRPGPRAAPEAPAALLPRRLHRDPRGPRPLARSGRMSDHVRTADLVEWCRIPVGELVGHPRLRVPFRLVKDSAEMGELMAARTGRGGRGEQRGRPADAGDHPVRAERAGTRRSTSWSTSAASRLARRSRSSTWTSAWTGRAGCCPQGHPYNFRDVHGGALLRPASSRTEGAGATTGTGWLPATIEPCAARSPRRRSTSRSAAGARTGTSPTTRPGATRSATSRSRSCAQSTDPRPGEQPRHDHRARPADVRRGVPVRPADVGHARDARSASRRSGSACSATPAPGSRRRCASPCSPSRRRSTR